MAKEGAIEMLVELLVSDHEVNRKLLHDSQISNPYDVFYLKLIQRQAAKALANLGVNAENKRKIAVAGGIPRLIRIAGLNQISVKIEAIAALANLAVSGINAFHCPLYACLFYV
jgi:hypothetical protein